MAAPLNFWEDLLVCEGAAGIRIKARVLRKQGRPFLLLPLQSRAAIASLDLYPAQTPRARLAMSLWRRLLQASVPLGMQKVSFVVQRDDPFIRFLAAQSGTKTDGPPTLGALAGNPASDGQRFLLLVFDDAQKPVAVVKTGMTDRAKDLVAKEQSVLKKIGGKAKGVPRLRGEFRTERLCALAIDFVAGDSPQGYAETTVSSLLTSWVDSTQSVPLSQTQDWLRLAAAVQAGGAASNFVQQLRDRVVHPVLQHGDFAPWNIKVSPTGDWTVLDWERGELVGIPGWDWFHYLIQPAILVDALPTTELIQMIERLLASPAFKRYAALTSLTGSEQQLVLAYLHHAASVIKPSEGLLATRELLNALGSRWRLS